MKKSARIVFASLTAGLLTLTLTACGDSGKKNNSQPITRSMVPGNRQAVTNLVQSVGGQAGRITAQPIYQQQFQEAVVAFLSADVSPQYIGSVSSGGATNSGVTFGGKVALQNGTVNQVLQGGSFNITPDSTIEIQVRDFVPQHPNAPPLPIVKLTNGRGTIAGGYAELQFSGNYGSVMMQGQINPMNQMFMGTISFDNNVMYDGSSPGQAGTLGDFAIPMCSFFVCR